MIIQIHAAAPPKPALGQDCNGCGVCCAAQPCPVGLFVLFQLRGRCRALLWQPEGSRYACGMVLRPADYLRWLPAALNARAGRLFARRIAAGSGCDADFELDDRLSDQAD